MQVSKQSV